VYFITQCLQQICASKHLNYLQNLCTLITWNNLRWFFAERNYQHTTKKTKNFAGTKLLNIKRKSEINEKQEDITVHIVQTVLYKVLTCFQHILKKQKNFRLYFLKTQKNFRSKLHMIHLTENISKPLSNKVCKAFHKFSPKF